MVIYTIVLCMIGTVIQHHNTIAETVQCAACSRGQICTGITSNLTVDDLLCIERNGCDDTYRKDSCGQCDHTLERYEWGSRLQDCSGRCYTDETINQALELDVCNVCGGQNETCNPRVTATVPDLIPDDQKATLQLTGGGLLTPGIQILGLSVSSNGGTKSVAVTAAIVTSQNGSNLLVDVSGLSKGFYEVGARTGFSGHEYESVTGPTLQVYGSSEFSVETIDPNSLDLGGNTTILDVTLHIATSKNISEFADTVYCLVASNRLSNVFYVNNATLVCKVAVPVRSMAYNVCASINGYHHIGCQELLFYAPEPKVRYNATVFSTNGDQLVVTFEVAVITNETRDCAKYFETVTALGRNPECRWSDDGKSLVVHLGAGATIEPGGAINLSPGFQAAGNEYARETAAITLTAVANDVKSISIGPRGFWSPRLTSFSPSLIELGIHVHFSPGSRPPASVVWEVNNETKEEAKDRMEITLNVYEPGEYNVTVNVTDVFGGHAVLKHTIVKLAALLPDAVLKPFGGIWSRIDGSFETNPNTEFGIATKISYVDSNHVSLKNFTFQWIKNGKNMHIGYQYRFGKSDITTKMCGETIELKLRVTDPSAVSTSVDNPLTLHVTCRNPVAKIAGGKVVDVPPALPVYINIDGETLSYDPDGGSLTYSWECSFDSYGSIVNCINYYNLNEQTNSPWLRFYNSVFRDYRDIPSTFKLTVSVMKNNRTYTSSDQVDYIPKGTERPWVKFMTLDHKFRHDVPIMIMAYIGPGVEAQWQMVTGLEDYGWVDINSDRVRQDEKVVESYAWFTIRPRILSPGQRYIMEVKATNTSVRSAVATAQFEIYIYKQLRWCSIVIAKPLIELEKTRIIVEHCESDDGLTSFEISCMLGETEFPIDDDLEFMVPRFKERTTTKAKLRCKMKDKFGHVLDVESNEVSVTLQSDVTQKIAELVKEYKREDSIVSLIELLSENIDGDNETLRTTQQTKIVQELKLLPKVLTIRETKRVLKAVNKLRATDIKEPEEAMNVAKRIQGLLGVACSKTAELSTEDIKELIKKAMILARVEKSNRDVYREIQELIACIQIKRMQNEEATEIQIEGDENTTQADGGVMGFRSYYMVGTLDSFSEKDLQTVFPEELKKRFRGHWNCQGEKKCNSIALKKEMYDRDSPDIQTGRKDIECSKYIYLDIYNPQTGSRMLIDELKQTIDIEFGNTCKRAACWYYQRGVKKFSQSGVTTGRGDNEQVVCKTNHLSAFTIQSEPVGNNDLNVPMIVGLVLGCVLLVASSVILIRAYFMAKTRKMEEEEKDYSVGYERSY